MHMYQIDAYGRMIADRVRTDAYAEALRRMVKPDSIVVDIGTGTGILALFACQFGAHKVYAIEFNDVIHLAREIASANGYAERIEFIQNMSTRVTLPKHADIIVSDLHGIFPLSEQALPAIIDARRRMLAPGGKLIPLQETLWVAVVEAPDLYRRHMTPWDEVRYNLNLRAVLRVTTNSWYKGRVTPEQLLTQPKCWTTLDYAVLENPEVTGKVAWTAERTGTAHGLIVWFDSTLAEDIHFSNAPNAPELIFGSGFFPLSNPIPLVTGDTVSVEISANLVGGDYIWGWNTFVLSQGKKENIKADFKQSAFYGMVLSQATLRKIAHNHNPILNEEGQIDQFALSLMDGHTPLGEIASRVMEKFPKHFAKWYDALTHVGNLSLKYGH